MGEKVYWGTDEYWEFCCGKTQEADSIGMFYYDGTYDPFNPNDSPDSNDLLFNSVLCAHYDRVDVSSDYSFVEITPDIAFEPDDDFGVNPIIYSFRDRRVDQDLTFFENFIDPSSIDLLHNESDYNHIVNGSGDFSITGTRSDILIGMGQEFVSEDPDDFDSPITLEIFTTLINETITTFSGTTATRTVKRQIRNAFDDTLTTIEDTTEVYDLIFSTGRPSFSAHINGSDNSFASFNTTSRYRYFISGVSQTTGNTDTLAEFQNFFAAYDDEETNLTATPALLEVSQTGTASQSTPTFAGLTANTRDLIVDDSVSFSRLVPNLFQADSFPAAAGSQTLNFDLVYTDSFVQDYELVTDDRIENDSSHLTINPTVDQSRYSPILNIPVRSESCFSISPSSASFNNNTKFP